MIQMTQIKTVAVAAAAVLLGIPTVAIVVQHHATSSFVAQAAEPAATVAPSSPAAAPPPPATAPADAAASSGILTADFKDGTRLQVLGVCDWSSPDQTWWKPDGTALPEPPNADLKAIPALVQTIQRSQQRMQPAGPKQDIYVFAVQLSRKQAGEADEPWDLRWTISDPNARVGPGQGMVFIGGGPPAGGPPPGLVRVPGGGIAGSLRIAGGFGGGGIILERKHSTPGDGVDLLVTSLANIPEGATVRCQVAGATWKVEQSSPANALANGFADLSGNGNMTKFSFTIDLSAVSDDIRFIAIDNDGKAHIGGTTGSRAQADATGATTTWQCQVKLPIDQIKELQYQTRPFDRSVEFRNVCVDPAHATQPSAAVEDQTETHPK
jgi:hypothetical protein